MARIHISADGSAIKMLRRQHRVIGLQVRVVNERVYVMKKADYVYTRSQAQDECRERFRRAQEMMLVEFEDPERVKYWERRAKKKHFKTAKGCCKSYFYHKITDMDIKERNRLRSEKSAVYHEAQQRGDEAIEEYNELRSVVYKPVTYGTESADVMKERRLQGKVSEYERQERERAIAHSNSEQYVYMVVRKRIDEVTDEEILKSNNIYVRNGGMSMSVDKKDFVYYRKKGRIDKFLRKKRIEQADDCGLPTFRYYGLSNRERRYYDGKTLLTSDVMPKHKRRMEVTLKDLQTYDYKDELKFMDIFVTVAARKVFLDSELIEKLRDRAFLRDIKGLTESELRSILRVNTISKKS